MDLKRKKKNHDYLKRCRQRSGQEQEEFMLPILEDAGLQKAQLIIIKASSEMEKTLKQPY